MSKKPSYLSIILWITPILASTTYLHFKEGPPAPSWSLKYYLLMAVIRAYLSGPAKKLTAQQLQKGSMQRHRPLPKNCRENQVIVSDNYRKQGGQILCNLFDQQDQDLIGWDWQADRMSAAPLPGSWIQSSQPAEKVLLYFHGGAYFMGTYKLYLPLLGNLAQTANANVFTVDYRLSPQHPFPSAVEDALAAYLYLLDPPEDAPFRAIPASQIVVSGDSAGGGLTMALLMMIRDTGLPMPAGAMPLSPWLDLTHCLPSVVSNEVTDYLPPAFSLTSTAPFSVYESEKLAHQDLDGPPNQLHAYTHNRCLKHYLVSPLYDKYRWHGLPPLLIQTGDAEQLRDESICASLKATGQFSDPPLLDSVTHSKSLPPTQVTLDLYEDQPHVFQLLWYTKSVERSINSMAAFLQKVTTTTNKTAAAAATQPAPLLTIRSVSPKGELQNITKDMIKLHAGSVWQDWQRRLEDTSFLSSGTQIAAKM